MIERLLGWVLRRFPPRELITFALLFVSIICLVDGVGGTVRGAMRSVFLPTAISAALLGWAAAQSRFKGWQAAGWLVPLGGILLWGYTAQWGEPLLQLLSQIPTLLTQTLAYWRDSNLPTPDLAPAQAALDAITQQSGALWQRAYAWLFGVGLGINVNDPVMRVLVWGLALWLLAVWTGWNLRRKDALTALAPVLVALAALSGYTGKGVTSLWLLLTILVCLMGLARYNINLRNWKSRKLDYAEIISANTLLALSFITLVLGFLAWFVPMISVKDIAEALRRPSKESTTAKSLGLEKPNEPGQAVAPRPPTLPQRHLIKAGPELSQDQVFTVKTGELPPMGFDMMEQSAPRYYWRSQIYDIYMGTGWLSSPIVNQSYAAEQKIFEAVPSGYRILSQQYKLNHEDNRTLYWAGTLYRSDQSITTAWRIPPDRFGPDSPAASDPFRSADPFAALNTSPTYRVESLLPLISIEKLRSAGTVYPDYIQKNYLALPESVPERVFALAREITATSVTPYDQARAIERYLRANYEYTLDVPAPPQNSEVADFFLFELKKGYCDYYATSMAVLARAVGIPARLVTGYANGIYDAPNAEYDVTEANAHSWVEIYFPSVGWVEFEPTGGLPEINRPDKETDIPASLPPPPVSPWVALQRSFQDLPLVVRWALPPLFLGLLFIGLFATVESFVLLRVSPARALRWMYRDVYRYGGKFAGRPTASTTATEFAAALETHIGRHPELLLLTSTYLTALFSPIPPTRQEVGKALRAWRSLRWRLLTTRHKREKINRS